MDSISSHKEDNINNRNNYYFLKCNENLSSFISNIIDFYRKNKNKDIFINSIFFNEEMLYLIFISFSNQKYYLTFIPVTSQDTKIKEIELIFPKKCIFKYERIQLSEDKNHLILFNIEKNKIFILFNYAKRFNLEDKILLDNYYENLKNKIIDVKFNYHNSSTDKDNSTYQKDLIIYGINCNNSNLSLFNNDYLNKEFQIYFNEPFMDFQFVNNSSGGYDLYIMNSYGNIRFIKNIQDIKNIPKSDKNELIQKVKIYDRIVHNISNCPMLLKNEFIKFYFQPQNNINETIKKETNIISILRMSSDILDIGVLINGKLFLIKKYYLDKEKDDKDKENFNSIIPINNYLNKYLIISNNTIYLLDIPSLFNLYLPLSENNSYNEEQKKQSILLIINEIISKMTLSVVLQLPLKNDINFSINYNFYQGSIFCIQRQDIYLKIRIYNFELDDPTLYENESDNSIIYDKNNNQKNNDTYSYMENTLLKIKIEIDNLKKREINDINNGEYCNKVLEEFSTNINNLINIHKNNNNSNNNISNNINLINNYYKKLYIAIKIYGQHIKDKNEFINDYLVKRKKIEESLKKDDENINNLMNSINNKLKLIEENQNKIIDLRKKNNDNMYKYYLINMNNKNEEKNCCNELIKRINNHTLKNIEFMQNKIKENNCFDKLNFEELKNFPLTMKYLNNNQMNDINYIINMIKKLINILIQYHEQFKKE